MINDNTKGGAIIVINYNYSLSLLIDISNIICNNNQANIGGCIHITGYNIIINNSILLNNIGYLVAGAIYGYNVELNMYNGSTYNNGAIYGGGGIYVDETNLKWINGNCINNTVNGGIGGGGCSILSWQNIIYNQIHNTLIIQLYDDTLQSITNPLLMTIFEYK